MDTMVNSNIFSGFCDTWETYKDCSCDHSQSHWWWRRWGPQQRLNIRSPSDLHIKVNIDPHKCSSLGAQYLIPGTFVWGVQAVLNACIDLWDIFGVQLNRVQLGYLRRHDDKNIYFYRKLVELCRRPSLKICFCW